MRPHGADASPGEFFFFLGVHQGLQTLNGITATKSCPEKPLQKKQLRQSWKGAEHPLHQSPNPDLGVNKEINSWNKMRIKIKKKTKKKPKNVYPRSVCEMKQPQNVLHIRHVGKQGHQMFFDVNNGIYY